MASQVEIVNLALTLVGKKRCSSLLETTEEVGVVNAVYNLELDAMLSEHAWDFACQTITLALTADTYTEWDYAYAYPSDCLQVLGCVNENTQWEVAVSNDGLSRRILCNEEDAEFRYIARITDCNMWSPTFRTAFATRLAMAIVLPLQNDSQKLKDLAGLYNMQITAAFGADARQCNLPLPTSTPSIDARQA
jgi:hypothetical protein